jgi:hypothetical protein
VRRWTVHAPQPRAPRRKRRGLHVRPQVRDQTPFGPIQLGITMANAPSPLPMASTDSRSGQSRLSLRERVETWILGVLERDGRRSCGGVGHLFHPLRRCVNRRGAASCPRKPASIEPRPRHPAARPDGLRAGCGPIREIRTQGISSPAACAVGPIPAPACRT